MKSRKTISTKYNYKQPQWCNNYIRVPKNPLRFGSLIGIKIYYDGTLLHSNDYYKFQ